MEYKLSFYGIDQGLKIVEEVNSPLQIALSLKQGVVRNPMQFWSTMFVGKQSARLVGEIK